MEMMDTIFLCFAILMPLIAYFVGRMVRHRTHMIYPFVEPLSWFLVILTVSPFVAALIAKYDVTPLGIWPYALLGAFWVGYILGYSMNKVDVVRIAVHKLADNVEDESYMVLYTNKDGQRCWQPQTFIGACRTVLFDVHNTIRMDGPIQRKRTLIVHEPFLPKIEVDVIDMAHVEIHTADEFTQQGVPREENPLMVKKGPFWFKLETREYIPSPIDLLPTGTYYSTAKGLDIALKQNAKFAMQVAESEAQIEQRSLELALDVLNALMLDSPSRAFMEEIGAELRNKDMAFQRDVQEHVNMEVQNNV